MSDCEFTVFPICQMRSVQQILIGTVCLRKSRVIRISPGEFEEERIKGLKVCVRDGL